MLYAQSIIKMIGGIQDVHILTVTVPNNMLIINLEVTAPAHAIFLKKIKQVQQLLQQEIDRSVACKVRGIPVNEFEALAEVNG